MVPASGPWALLGNILSYIVKLAPILWWALRPQVPRNPPQAGSLTPSSQYLPKRGLNLLRKKCPPPLRRRLSAPSQPPKKTPAHPDRHSGPPASPSPACLPSASLPATSLGPAAHPLVHPVASMPAASPQPTCLLPGLQSAASHPPGSQGLACNQSETLLKYSQSKKSLNTREDS
ncbi:hypothetical protein DSO57_1000369 [Entomophthora muscae]|uniref:Uncharacterized protein n=1 Tax=Entomophthora muscae TaxID=34485 RepID=A0ACC2TKF8_9FUNG|nr:hypothetical protein DSO57_1000369 [Entomophthora muscae]